MGLLKELNAFRRKYSRKLAKNIGRSQPGQSFDKIAAGEIKTILINRPNHRLGNMLLITPLLQELIANFPQSKIDLFVKGGLAPVLFKNYPQVDKIIRLPKKPFKELIKYARVWVKIRQRKYDLVINVDKVSSSGRISTKVANARFKFFGDENEAILSLYKDGNHMAKRPVYLLRQNIELPVTGRQTSYIPSLNIRLADEELAEGKRLLDALVPQDKKTISLFTYATGAKCYTPDWWDTFYQLLQNRFPSHNFLEVLPAENVSQLNFKIPSFYSMDVREICAVIANTAVFIGADSGMMHLASASGTTTFGLFSVTNLLNYAPFNNGSMGFNTNDLSVEELIKSIAASMEARGHQPPVII
ncbi:MAG: lipopolysaccharide heptosyltransferase family protein [Chitinophagaceae bacterium]|nr:MAG: lipopolysaccharide heptosyltransferase family protein [Chitinophagaceae bacterium]